VSVHDPRLHDPKRDDARLAALLAGVPDAALAAAPGLARLLTSLMTPSAPAEPVAAPNGATAPGPDLETLLREARAEGEAVGRIAGEAEGRAAAAAELADLRAALRAAAAAASALTRIDEAQLAPLLQEIVKAVAEAVLMQELSSGGRALVPLVSAALAEAGAGSLPQLHAHPDTLALLAGDLPAGLATAADAALPPGHVVVSGPDYRIEAGLAERLARLVEAL
jgi:flagellar biosynthesis/type III secretory pathway protein FliH